MTKPEAVKAIIRCADCTAERTVKPTAKGEARTPAGWKHHADAYYCGACWSKRYMLRAVSMPVASPLDCSWDELRAALKPMWAATTAACNWMLTEMYTRDVRRNGEAKIPPMAPVYLYPEARAKFPALPPQTVAALEHTIQRKYRAARYEIVWAASAALPTYRYPTPFPCSSQSWHATIEEDRPIVSVRVGDVRLRLRLKSGPQFRRQFAQFRLVARGEAVQGEAAIYQQGSALMVKLVAWLPRPAQAKGADGILSVRTATDCLLVAANGKDEAMWRYNGDHLRRWAAEHRRQLQRWSEDAKCENRPIPTFAERREAACRRFRDRMNSATHEIAAQLAGYAARRRFAGVRYDDSEHGFCQAFPWFRLRALIAEKLDERGIEFVASGGANQEPPEPLAEEESQ